LGKRRLDVLCARIRHDIGYALGLGELLGQLHDQTRDGDAARRPQEFGLVRVLDSDGGGPTHHIFSIWLRIVLLKLGQLLLEIAHLVLQVDDVVAGNLAAFGGVKVLAVGVCALAGTAAGEAGIASCLALHGEDQYGLNWDWEADGD
jgi:hypothetical protein